MRHEKPSSEALFKGVTAVAGRRLHGLPAHRCQIASNSAPLFASNIDPLSGTVWSLSMSCIGGTRARSAAPQALRGAKGTGGPCASRGSPL